jgi:hypothetical protein
MTSAFIDASNVYGSDPDRASALRMLDGSELLKQSQGQGQGQLLPLNTEALANDGGSDNLELFVAGDVRRVDDVRNFLFGPPGVGGFDLASLNIQRRRDQASLSAQDISASMS